MCQTRASQEPPGLPSPDESEYALLRRSKSLSSSIPQSHLSSCTTGLGIVTSCVKTLRTSYSNIYWVTTSVTNSLMAVINLLPVSRVWSLYIVPAAPAAAAELSNSLPPTSHPGLGVVSSNLFRGGVSASGISALRLVNGAGRGIGNNGGVPDGLYE
ncbi:hypothetical protein Tco_0521745 [Tanacetum coccineum]